MMFKVSSAALTTALTFVAPSSAQTPPSAPRLSLPIACVPGKTCEIQSYVDRDPGPGAQDYRCGPRTYDGHQGVDFRLLDMAAQRAGVSVLAAADGKVSRVRDGVADISIKDPAAPKVPNQECGNGVVIEHNGGLSTQYCHMARGSLLVKPGDTVKAGAPLGRVGLSGNTEFPHLHLTVRKDSVVVDPFAPSSGQAGQCGAGASLWRPETAATLAYKERVVLNAGFTTGVVTMAQLEAGGMPPPSPLEGALVAYVRAIGLKAQDVQTLKIVGPAGQVLVATTAAPLPRDQAQRLIYVGKPRPAAGWLKGRYLAHYVVQREGRVVLERSFDVAL
jgi:hypothetical protein